jgi:hypothetical protein
LKQHSKKQLDLLANSAMDNGNRNQMTNSLQGIMNYRTEDSVMNKRIGEYSDPNQLQSNAPSSVRTGKKK